MEILKSLVEHKDGIGLEAKLVSIEEVLDGKLSLG